MSWATICWGFTSPDISDVWGSFFTDIIGEPLVRAVGESCKCTRNPHRDVIHRVASHRLLVLSAYPTLLEWPYVHKQSPPEIDL